MELYWKIKGVEFGIRSLGYSWTVVKEVDTEDLFYLDHARYNHAWTLLGAQFAAWSYARRWASFDGCDEVLHVFETKPDGTPDKERPLWKAILPIKVVPVFWPIKPKD